ncbi:hypothetical protein CXG81DRAFT_23236 [Caulochytrium protostelioides]|uniref:GATA-type domain-containing protein n=1 Tax=Caulochytrium protostelioides TaxID=1555241 RepID=A0A4P9XF13_9FUNG|nr:hypothetical protein CXG81DRAFT_23236 [Caulochytrium protostelioides]|eukprot:RKP04128.1 hypothetical protein CXG81DRAFT_23236 [Caulochytrium protostelioides]
MPTVTARHGRRRAPPQSPSAIKAMRGITFQFKIQPMTAKPRPATPSPLTSGAPAAVATPAAASTPTTITTTPAGTAAAAETSSAALLTVDTAAHAPVSAGLGGAVIVSALASPASSSQDTAVDLTVRAAAVAAGLAPISPASSEALLPSKMDAYASAAGMGASVATVHGTPTPAPTPSPDPLGEGVSLGMGMALATLEAPTSAASGLPSRCVTPVANAVAMPMPTAVGARAAFMNAHHGFHQTPTPAATPLHTAGHPLEPVKETMELTPAVITPARSLADGDGDGDDTMTMSSIDDTAPSSGSSSCPASPGSAETSHPRLTPDRSMTQTPCQLDDESHAEAHEASSTTCSTVSLPSQTTPQMPLAGSAASAAPAQTTATSDAGDAEASSTPPATPSASKPPAAPTSRWDLDVEIIDITSRVLYRRLYPSPHSAEAAAARTKHHLHPYAATASRVPRSLAAAHQNANASTASSSSTARRLFSDSPASHGHPSSSAYHHHGHSSHPASSTSSSHGDRHYAHPATPYYPQPHSIGITGSSARLAERLSSRLHIEAARFYAVAERKRPRSYDEFGPPYIPPYVPAMPLSPAYPPHVPVSQPAKKPRKYPSSSGGGGGGGSVSGNHSSGGGSVSGSGAGFPAAGATTPTGASAVLFGDNTGSGSDTDRRPVRMQTTTKGICLNCDTRKTGQWRKGPWGPRTMCNACGLEWSKRIKAESIRKGVSIQEMERRLTRERLERDAANGIVVNR